MKFLHKFITKTSTLTAAVLASAVLGVAGHASAACTQYDPNATTPTTPVFNNICGVPNGVGNEPDFVRIRQSSNGNDEDNQNNPTYTVGSLTAACNDGDKFDVWTYIHNNAVSGYNDNGSGTAVAHNVALALNAPDLNTNNNKFNFMSAVSASNASGVQDSVTLNCGDKQVKLTLVPSTVHVYSQQYNWQNLADSSVNSTFKIGSPVAGSGDQWGCWEYRVVVVYQVTVQTVQKPQVTASCDMFSVLANSDRTVTVNTFKYTASNVNFSNAVINWGDNTSNTTVNNANQVVGQTHTYANFGTYLITAVVNFSNGATSGGTGTACMQKVTFTQGQPPVILTSTPPTRLVNTGPGEVVGLFGGATAAGAFGYRKFLSRRLGR